MKMWLLLILSLLGLCGGAVAQAPLSDAELQALMPELDAYVRVKDVDLPGYVPQRATPAMVERAFATPAFVHGQGLRYQVRQHALALLGPGRSLRFDKPSDVLATFQRLLPEEMVPVLGKPFETLHLHGPLPQWSDDAVAFMTLWHCLPRVAWLRPGEDPFGPASLEDSIWRWGFAANGNEDDKADFGYCVRRQNNRATGSTQPEHDALKRLAEQMGKRAVPLLADRFARFLQRDGCGGSGPDDCMLILLAWSSLTPADPRLAATLQRPAPDLGLDRPLPALQRTAADYGSYGQGGWPPEPLHAAVARRAALLRARLASQLAAPGAWPDTALVSTLAAMGRLSDTSDAMLAPHWTFWTLERQAWVDPWRVLQAAARSSPALQEQALDTVLTLGDDPDCRLHERWLAVAGPASAPRALLKALQSGAAMPLHRCRMLDWNWLRRGETAQAQALRDSLAEAIGRPALPTPVRDELLGGITQQGADCLPANQAGVAASVQALCRRWIHEPQHTPLALANSRLTLDAHQAFVEHHVSAPGGYGQTDTAWQAELWQGLAPAFAQPLREHLQALNTQGIQVSEGRVWRRPGHSRVLVMLQLADNVSTRRWFVLSPSVLAALQVPQRLTESREWGHDVVAVSDLDGDGQLELWFASRFRDCRGDDSDLARDMDCQARDADMGEVQGEGVSYFTRDMAQASAKGDGVLPLASAAAQPLDNCNRLRVALALADRFPVQAGKEPSDDATRFRQLVCKPHPDQPGQLLAAFLYETGEGEKGFGLALIDTARDRLLRIYHEPIEEDATTRVGDCCIALDTARYFLKPGLRAVGLRLQVDSGPRYAEGGSTDRFVLLAPEGARNWRVVLSGLSMSSWHLTNSTQDCFRGEDPVCERDEDTLALALAPGTTAGWRDLLLTTTTVNDTQPGPPRRSSRLLRMGKSGRYE